MVAGRTRSRHTRTRSSSLLCAAQIVAAVMLVHVAAFGPTSAAVAASGTSKPAPTANTFVDSNGQPFARCMSTNPATAYCPHNSGNSEQPEAAKAYNTNSMLRMTWNSKWPSFATTGAVDLYLCPTDGTKCIPMATDVSVSVEIVDALIDPAIVKPGRYTYVVVPLKNKPEDTSFGERGVELAIQAGPTTSTISSASSSASPTATSSTTSWVLTGPTPTFRVESGTKTATEHASTALTAVVGSLIVVFVVVVAAVMFARKRRRKRSLAPNVQKPAPPMAVAPTATSTITAAPLTPTTRELDEPMYLPSAPVEPDQVSLYLPTSQQVLTPVLIEDLLYLPGRAPQETTAETSRATAPLQ